MISLIFKAQKAYRQNWRVLTIALLAAILLSKAFQTNYAASQALDPYADLLIEAEAEANTVKYALIPQQAAVRISHSGMVEFNRPQTPYYFSRCR